MHNFKILIIALLAFACGQPNTSEEKQKEPISKSVVEEVKKEKIKATQRKATPKKVAEPISQKVAEPTPQKKQIPTSENVTPAKNGRLIYNAARPLRWSDFKGRVQPGFAHDAYTQAGIAYEPLDYNNQFVILKIDSYFDENLSWVKPEKKGDYLLAHEQKHFEVCEVYRRKMMKQLDNAQPIDPAKFNDVVKKYFKLNFNAMTATQKSYDAQTLHGAVKNKQKIWNEKIENDLKKLEAYKDMTIKLVLK